MSKFHLNLLPQFSKALVNSKIQFLIQKFFSFTFGLPGHAASRPTRPPGPRGQQDHSASQPTPPADPLGLSAHATAGLLPPRTGRAPPLPPPAPPRHGRRPSYSLPCFEAATVAPHNPPSSIGRNNTHPSLPEMAATKAPITAAACGFQAPPPPPGPYKRPPPPRSDSAPLTTSLPFSLTPEHAPVEPHRRHHSTLVAPPLRRSPSSGEPRGEFLTPLFPFSAATGEHGQAGAPPRPFSGDFPSALPCVSTVDRPEDFPLQNKSEKLKFSNSWHFCREAPEFLYN
jgi:hypothetical protein